MRATPRAMLALVVLLLAPLASAWEVSLVAQPAGASLRESLLVAGALSANGTGGTFGAPQAERLLFDVPVSVQHCPDQAGDPQTASNCPGGEALTGVRFYVHAGGVVVQAPPDAPATLDAPATAAAFGGPEVVVNRWSVGPGVYAGGESVVVANGTGFVVRPVGSGASIELRGNEGFRIYNGTAYTLAVAAPDGAAFEARLEARGAFLAGEVEARVTRAPLREAESSLVVDDLYALLRGVQPPERADRRADASETFGLFQLVPGLVNGAAAARANLTLNGETREDFTFVRLTSANFSYTGTHWYGAGDARYMLDGDVLASRPDIDPRFPVVVPLVLVAAAFAGRALTHRARPLRKQRRIAGALRAAGLALLVLVAAWRLTPLLGFSPLLDFADLALRSRVQLALLVLGMVASAYLAIGFPAESVVRSAFAWRERPRAIIVASLAGIVATLVFLVAATAILLSFVARFVRL